MKSDLIETIRFTLSLKDGEINESTRLNQLVSDSFDLLDLVLALSSKYDIVLEPEDLNGLHTIGDVINHLERRRSPQANP